MLSTFYCSDIVTKSFAALLPRGSHFVRQAHHVLLLIKPLKINVFYQRPEPQKRHLGNEIEKDLHNYEQICALRKVEGN